MAKIPSIPKGTRDFFPSQMIRRNYIFDTIKTVFQLYGFQPIETPALENLSTLMGKYGEEGDKLLFKVLNSGDFLKESNFTSYILDTLNENKIITCKDGNYEIKVDSLNASVQNLIKDEITEKGLRYDLTVPFARFVVQNRNELVFPFKRYQIQPVWRADRPQKGRYREFFQCDVDIIGSDSLLNELELIQIVDDVFNRLNIGVTLKLNNRKILTGIAETIGAADRVVDITVAIDKLDKIGSEKVYQELEQKGVSKSAILKLQPFLALTGSGDEKLNQISSVISGSEVGMKGIREMQTIFTYLKNLNLKIGVELDLTLARGLNYYTGAIFEVKANDVEIGSITGGGRYDDLTGIFGLPGVSGVGISFGADRIYDVMDQLNLFPESALATSKVIFTNFGPAEEMYVLPIVNKFRQSGISCELYPEADKMKKQLNYANRKGIPFVVLAGESEIQSGKLTLKNMGTGDQQLLTPEEIISFFKK